MNTEHYNDNAAHRTATTVIMGNTDAERDTENIDTRGQSTAEGRNCRTETWGQQQLKPYFT